MTLNPPSAIIKGIQAAVLDGVKASDLQKIDGHWVLPISINIDVNDDIVSMVPSDTEWFVLIDTEYPFGFIGIYPSKKNSIICTFEHQEINLPGKDVLPWRTGKLCLETQSRGLNLAVPGEDPIGNYEERLRWHLLRAIKWINDARTGALVRNGDPFEIPWCPSRSDIQVIHDESPSSFNTWKVTKHCNWGQVIWDVLKGVANTFITAAFTQPDGQDIIRTTSRYDEAVHGASCDDRLIGIWWLWPVPIVIDPWQVPLTWSDLRLVGKKFRVDVDEYLRKISELIRGKESIILLIGYPIPLYRGGPAIEIHWDAIMLPNLVYGGKQANGFRTDEEGWWQRDKVDAFKGNKMISYLSTSNWNAERLQARGRYIKHLRDSRLAIIGCGALGSNIAELLVRGGVSDVLLIDHDVLAAGNLVRHTLYGDDVGKNKAISLANKLGTIVPFALIRSYDKRLPTGRESLVSLLENRDIVLDCTGADDTLMGLSQGWWAIPKLFVSSSVSYEASRSFIFAHKGCVFPYNDFRMVIEPYLVRERKQLYDKGEILEGAGCWSPLFPARMDDIMLSAVICGKVIEKLIDKDTVVAKLIVFENSIEGAFAGVRFVDDISCKDVGQ